VSEWLKLASPDVRRHHRRGRPTARIDHPFEGAVIVGPAPLERVISDVHNAP
jgi:hypothetical protein